MKKILEFALLFSITICVFSCDNGSNDTISFDNIASGYHTSGIKRKIEIIDNLSRINKLLDRDVF